MQCIMFPDPPFLTCQKIVTHAQFFIDHPHLSAGISVTVSVPSNKVRAVIVLTKNVVKIISLVL